MATDHEVNAFVGLCLLFVSENWKGFQHWMTIGADELIEEEHLQELMSDAMMTTQLARVAAEVWDD